MSFVVLFVCTGNICRSPMAERLFAARIRDRAAPVVVTSAGTNGLTGWAMDAPSAVALTELGGDPDGHVARRLSDADIEQADVILTATTEHRAAVLARVPLAMRRTFTMREFARLGDGLDALTHPDETMLRQRVRAVADRRGVFAAAAPGADEIADPYGGTTEAARQAARTVGAAVDAIATALGID